VSAVSRHDGVPRRALVGNLKPVARVGMESVLEDGGIQVVGAAERPDAIVEEARRLQPDAIVLGFEPGRSSDLGDRVRDAAPGAKLILCAHDETEIQVFDPGSSAPRRFRASVSDALLSELSAMPAGGRE
jgi:DNA-binding NarL/FixJ family response regulator